MDKITGRSMFDKYYSRIQGMLFDGYTIKETFDYICKYFGLYTSYGNFWRYVKSHKLDWFMPDR